MAIMASLHHMLPLQPPPSLHSPHAHQRAALHFLRAPACAFYLLLPQLPAATCVLSASLSTRWRWLRAGKRMQHEVPAHETQQQRCRKARVTTSSFQDRTRSVATHAAAPSLNMSLVLEADSFTHILRIMSTNVDGKRKVGCSCRSVPFACARFCWRW